MSDQPMGFKNFADRRAYITRLIAYWRKVAEGLEGKNIYWQMEAIAQLGSSLKANMALIIQALEQMVGVEQSTELLEKMLARMIAIDDPTDASDAGLIESDEGATL